MQRKHCYAEKSFFWSKTKYYSKELAFCLQKNT